MRPTLLPLALLAAAHTTLAADTAAFTDYRQHTMKAAEGHLRAAKVLAVKGLRIPGHLEHHAEALKQFGELLPDLFPAGSGGGESEAKTAIWSDAQGFRDAQGAFDAAAADLVRAAKEMDGVADAYYRVQETCRNCHKQFRER